MNDAQRAEFSERGYFVVKGALPAAKTTELNALYDSHLAAGSFADTGGRTTVKSRGTRPVTDRHGRAYDGRRFWGQPFVDLCTLPTVLPMLEELLGKPSWGHAPAAVPIELRRRVRLDHDNIHFHPAHAGGCGQPDTEEATRKRQESGLHGGPTAHHITVVFELKSVGPGEGGFGCLPGSHRPEHNELLERTLPDGWRFSWCDTPWTQVLADWPLDQVPIDRVEAQACDVIIFTEKMKHGTIPWSGAGERRTLFYKYVPFGMHHNDAGYDVTAPGLTDRQVEVKESAASTVACMATPPASHRVRTAITVHCLPLPVMQVLEFPPVFFNEREIDGEVMKVGTSKDSGEETQSALRHPDVQTAESWHFNWRQAANL
jgi:hypothetical protein